MLFQTCCCGTEDEVTQVDFSVVPEETVSPSRGAHENCPVLLGNARVSADQKRQPWNDSVATVVHYGHEPWGTPSSKQQPPALKERIGGAVPQQASPDEPVAGSHSPVYAADADEAAPNDDQPDLPLPLFGAGGEAEAAADDEAVLSPDGKARRYAEHTRKGCPCTVLEGRRFRRSSALYSVEDSDGIFKVRMSRSETPDFSCSVGQIQDIYTVEEDGKDCFPDDLLAHLDPEEMDLLVMIVYADGRRRRRTFYMLDATRRSREMLLEVLRLLSVEAQGPPKVTSKR